MSCRNGPGVGRYAAPEDRHELERVHVVGAAPPLIDFDPSGSARTLAYFDRVDRQVERMREAFSAWARARWGTDIPAEEQTAPTEDQRAFLTAWPTFYARWQAHKVNLTKGLTFWSPSAEWDRTVAFETELETLRLQLAALIAAETPDVKKQVTVPDPPPVMSDGKKGFEEPGGVDQPGLLSSVAGDIPWGTIGTIAVVALGAWILSSVAGIASR